MLTPPGHLVSTLVSRRPWMTIVYAIIKGLNSTCLFLMKVWSDRGSTCKFRNARSAFRNLHVDPLSLHTFMRNKQVEFNPYIYTFTTLSKLYRFGYEISVFNTKHPVIILRVSLFAVTPSHVASTKIECQNFSYVYRSRKHWECKYLCNNESASVIPCFVLAVNSCHGRLNLNETRRRYFKYGLQFNIPV